MPAIENHHARSLTPDADHEGQPSGWWAGCPSTRESAELARRRLAEAIVKENVDRDQLTIRADRGSLRASSNLTCPVHCAWFAHDRRIWDPVLLCQPGSRLSSHCCWCSRWQGVDL
jgi:hypothetical protein